MYIIIVGGGDIGGPLTGLATTGGNEVVVVEQEPAKAETVASSYDCLVINDDATVKETLVDAGAEQADAIISTTDVDATNIMVCLLAQELDIDRVVSVVHDPAHMDIFRRIGANTIENPQRLIAEYLYQSIKRPSISDYMRVGEDAAIFEITVVEGAPIDGLTLQEAAEDGLLDDETLVIAVERGGTGEPVVPAGTTTIEAGDEVTVYSGTGASPEITDVFGHFEDH